jgi:hypothetical protein
VTFEHETVTLANLNAVLDARDAAGWTVVAILSMNANMDQLGDQGKVLCVFSQ